MNTTSKIRRQGGAAVMTIPAAVLAALGSKVGAELSLTVSDGELIVRPATQPRRRYSLRELLRGSEHVAELNRQTHWARDGEPVGREIC